MGKVESSSQIVNGLLEIVATVGTEVPFAVTIRETATSKSSTYIGNIALIALRNCLKNPNVKVTFESASAFPEGVQSEKFINRIDRTRTIRKDRGLWNPSDEGVQDSTRNGHVLESKKATV